VSDWPIFGCINHCALPLPHCVLVFHLKSSFSGKLISRLHGRHAAIEELLLFRCFLWLVSELANVWDSQVELAGSVVGGGSKVDEVLESPSHSLC